MDVVNWVKRLGSVVIAAVAIIFGWGVAWRKGGDFVNTLYSRGNRLGKLDEDIAGLKKNLGDLGTTPYEMELASDGGAAICELGSVVIGIIRDNQRIPVRCASVGRAAWNPNSPSASERNHMRFFYFSR